MRGKKLAAVLLVAALAAGTVSAAWGEASGTLAGAGSEGSLSELTDEDFRAAASLREQGDNGWYYLYGDAARKYYLCRNEGGVWKTPDDFYASISDSAGIASMHPAPDYDMIKMWRTDRAGRAQVGAYVTRGPNGDGVRVSASVRRYDGKGGYGAAEPLGDPVFVAPETTELEFYRETALGAGDLVFFSLNKFGDVTSDSTAVKLGIRFSPEGEAADLSGVSVGESRVLDTTGYFSDVQGGNNWFYTYGRPDRYVLMEYGMGWGGEPVWHGFEAYSHVGPTGMHPGAVYGSMRIWVADRDGTAAVEGSMGKSDRNGDGVNAGIYHNGRALVERKLAGTENETIFIDESVEVKRGDTLVFYVDSGDHRTNANDSFGFKLEVYWTEEHGEPVEGEELSAYLNVVSPLELAGGSRGDGFFGLDSEREPKGEESAGCGTAGLGGAGPDGPGMLFLGIPALAAALPAVRAGRRRRI